VIRSFKEKEAEVLFRTRKASKRLAPYAKAALRKLDQLDVVDDVNELRIPPDNELKRLHGRLEGLFQMRIDDVHRVRFRWEGKDAYDVEVGDFH
jgi:proteic killer suppression protein